MMAGSFNTREKPSELQDDGDPYGMSAKLRSTRVLWMGHEGAPPGVAKILTHVGCVVCDRDDSTWPPQRIAWLAQVSAAARVHRSLRGHRIAVVHPDPGAADALAEALRASGAQVVVLSLGEAGLDRAEALDPEVIVMQPDHLDGSGIDVLGSVWRHERLRWTPILLVPHARLGIAGASAPNVRELVIGINLLCSDYESLVRRACRSDPFDVRLEELGPMRTIRALLESSGVLRARFETADLTIQVDLGEGLIIGAQGGPRDSADQQSLLGVHAIAALQRQVAGRVFAWPVAYPAATNIMAPLEAMLLSQHAAPLLTDIVISRVSSASVKRAAPPEADDLFDRPTNQRALPRQMRAPAANENVPFSVLLPRKPLQSAKSKVEKSLPPGGMGQVARVSQAAPSFVVVRPTSLAKPSAEPSAEPSAASITEPSTASTEPRAESVTAPSITAPSAAVTAPSAAVTAPSAVVTAPSAPVITAPSAPVITVPSAPVITAPSAPVITVPNEVFTKAPRAASIAPPLAPPRAASITTAPVTTQSVARESLGPPVLPATPRMRTVPPPLPAARVIVPQATPAMPPRPLLSEAVVEPSWALDTETDLAPVRPRRISRWVRMAMATAAAFATFAIDGAWLWPNSGRSAPEQDKVSSVHEMPAAAEAPAAQASPSAQELPTLQAAPAVQPAPAVQAALAAEAAPAVQAAPADQAAPAVQAAPPPESLAVGAPDLTPPEAAGPSEDEEDVADESDGASPEQRRAASRLVGQGHQQRRNGKYEAARATYAEAARIYPRYPRALAGLAEAYLALRDKAGALDAARAVVRRRPQFADDHRLLGDAYQLNARMSEARSAWQRASALGSRTARERLEGAL